MAEKPASAVQPFCYKSLHVPLRAIRRFDGDCLLRDVTKNGQVLSETPDDSIHGFDW